MDNYFSVLNGINVNDKTEKKNGLTYEQGRKDAILTQQKPIENTDATAYTDVINEKEAANNGEQRVHLREGSQRSDGTNPGGQVRQLEEGAGRDQSRYAQRRPRDGEAANVSYGQKVSTAELGIKGGSKTDGVFLIKSGTTKAMQRAQQIAQQNGKELILFGGHDLHTDKAPDGARGYTDGKRIFARVDDPDFTVDQIVRHETGHNLIAEGKVNMDEVRKRVASAVGEDKVDTAASLYAAAYSGTEMTPDEIWEELVCDSLGDMNIFEGIDTVETFMSDFLGVTKQETETSQSTTRGPPTEITGKTSRVIDREYQSKFSGSVFSDVIELSNKEKSAISSAIKSGNAHLDESGSIASVTTQDFLYLVETFGNGDARVVKRTRVDYANIHDTIISEDEYGNQQAGSQRTYESYGEERIGLS